MKKRVLAALLALVMLFGALPMSVFAEDLETVEEPSGTFEPDEPEKYTYHLYYDFNYVGTGSTKWNIEYGPTADTSYTYTVDSQTLTCREGYNFLGWADGKNATEPDYRGGDTITLTWQNPTKTIYAVWKEKTQPQPDITDPTEFIGIKTVPVQCDNKAGHYMEYAIDGLIEKKCAELVWSTGSKEATLKLYPEKIAKRFSALKGTHTAVSTSVVTVTLAYNGGWKIDGAIPVIYVTCAAPEIPNPTDSVKEQYVTVVCDNKTAHPNIQYQLKNLPAGSMDVQWDRTATTAKLVLKPEKIAEHYGKSYGAHTAVNPADVVVPLTYANDTWSLSAAIPDVHVTCKPTYLTLTYDANAPAGKTVTNLPKPQTESLPAGSSVVTFQLSWAIPVCEGYKFLGWATDTSSTIATFPVENLGTDNWVSTTGEPNYILYAIWEKNPFHVTYRLKDENGKWVNAYEEDVPVAGCENHTLWTPAEKTGYKFTGWYQKAEDIGKKAEVTKLFDKTWVLYGDYTPVEYTITYDYRDKDIQEKKLYPENAETYTIEDTVTLNPITNKGMFGKTFLEWRCDLNRDGVAEKITEIPAGTTGNLTVYAYWNYPVSYTVYDEDGNEVEAYCETINVPEDSFGANLKPKSVEKDGYEFDGWYQNPKNFGNPNKRTETLDNAKNWKLYGELKYVEKPVYVYVQPTYKGIALTKSDAKAVAALARLGFTEGFNAGGKFVTLGKMMTAKTDVAGMVDEIDNGKLALYSEIDTTKFNEHVLNSIGWYSENALTLVTNTTHKGYEADGKIDAYHLNGTMSFQSVTFDAGTNDKVENMPADGYYLVNDRITLSAPTREGYTFLGWSAAQDTPVITANPETDGETLYPAGYEWNVIGDVTFTAKWQLNTYTLCTTLKLNGSDKAYEVPGRGFSWTYRESGEKDTDINYASFRDVLAAKAREIDAANTPSQKQIDIVFSVGKIADVEQEIKKYGQEGINWQPNNKNTAYVSASVYTYYDVTFMDGNTTLGTETVKYGETANFADPTKYGYNFTGWYTAAEGGDKVELTTPVTKSMTLYAQWDKKEYNVSASLYLNGNGTGTTRSVKGLYDTDINYDGEDGLKAQLKEAALAADAANEPNQDKVDIEICLNDKSGKPFDATTYGQEGYNWRNMEWTNPKDGQTRKWIVAYTWAYVSTYYDVTFMDGNTTLGTETVKYGEKLAAFDEPTKDGYKFLGWFTEADEAFDLTTPITKSMTLTAKWERNTYTIIYHGNGGVKVDGNKTHEQLTSKKLPIGEPTTLENAEFTRDNYRFLGWSYFENGSVYFNAAEKNVLFEESDIDENGNVHLYAIWKRLSYPVTLRYNANTTDEVTNMPEPLEQTKDSDETGNAEFNISGMIPGRAGYRFLGWAVNKPDAAEDDIDFKAGESSIFVVNYQDDITLYAVWQELYTVTYSYDPSLPAEVQATIPKDPDTYTVGQKVTTAAKPNSVRVGENIWTFKTWKLDGVEVAPNTQVEMVSGGLHFEGIWETKLIHYSLTIQYVDKKGKELAESHMDLLSKGEAYKVDSPKIKGYKLKNKDDAVIEGTMPGRNLTIEVVYIKKSTGGSSGTIDSPNKPTTKAPALTLNTDDHFAFINGYPDGSVQPEGNVTRAETAAILYRIMGDACQSYYKTNSSSYSDVARGDWYNTYVATLENAGVIVDTRTNGKFRPNDAITRAELASMIAQFADLESASAAKFNDVGSRYWAAEEIAIAAKMGWINGYPDGSFRPDRNVTRAELMAMVNRALGRTPKSADDLLSGMKTWRDNANVNAWYYLDVQEATNDHTYTKSGTHETWKKLL